MQSLTPLGQNLENWVKQYQTSWEQEFQRKKEKWFKMSHEQRVKYIKAVFQKLMEIAKEDKLRAGLEFLAWLRSPEGALAWPYLWRDEYKETMINVAYYGMNAVHKIMVLKALEGVAK